LSWKIAANFMLCSKAARRAPTRGMPQCARPRRLFQIEGIQQTQGVDMRTLIASAILATCCLSAQAYEFDFTARVLTSDWADVKVGATFTGHFVGNDPYASNDDSTYSGSRGIDFGFGSGELTADIGPYHISSPNPSIQLYDNANSSWWSDLFAVNASPMVYVNGTPFPTSAFSFSLSSRPGTLNAINGTDLPTTIDVAAFNDVAVGRMNFETVTSLDALTFTITSVHVAQVPEPGTWALMALGMAAIGLAARGQRTQA
jgi:hypothetical protein